MKEINELLGQKQCALAFFHNSYSENQMECSMSGEATMQVCSLLGNSLLEFAYSRSILDWVCKTIQLTIKMALVKIMYNKNVVKW